MKKEQRLKFAPADINNIRYIASSLIPQGVYRRAITLFEGLIALEDNVYDLQTLGALYLEVGDNEKALTYLEKALAKEATDEISLLNKIKALVYSDKKSAALDLATSFIKTCKDENLKEETNFIISILQ